MWGMMRIVHSRESNISEGLEIVSASYEIEALCV